MFYIIQVMNEQKLKSDLTKSAWRLSTSIKDTVSKNIVKAVNTKEINVDKKSLHTLIYLIQASVDSAFESSVKEFQRELDTHISSLASSDAKKK